MSYGAYRSAREAGDWSLAWVLALRLNEGEREAAVLDWWRVADLKTVAKLSSWRQSGGRLEALDPEKRDPLWWIDEPFWAVTLGGRELINQHYVRLAPLALKRAIALLEDVAPLQTPRGGGPDPAAKILEACEAAKSGDLDRMTEAERELRLAVISNAAEKSAELVVRTAHMEAKGLSIAARRLAAGAVRYAIAAHRPARPPSEEPGIVWTETVLRAARAKFLGEDP